MLFEVRIRLKSHALGSRRDHTNHYRFDRDEGGSSWALDHKHWNGLFNNAIANSGTVCDVNLVRFPDGILLPRLDLYRRVWKPRGSSKEVVNHHESMRKGTVLTFTIATLEYDNTNTHVTPPGIDELKVIFKRVGQYEGISPFGSKFGWGRFTLESIRPLGRSIVDGGEPTEGPSEAV